MSEQDKQDQIDLKEFLELYRTLRKLGKWAIYLLGMAFTIASLWLVIKQIKYPVQ